MSFLGIRNVSWVWRLRQRLVRVNSLGLLLKGLPFETKLRTRMDLGHFFLLVCIGKIFGFEGFLVSASLCDALEHSC